MTRDLGSGGARTVRWVRRPRADARGFAIGCALALAGALLATGGGGCGANQPSRPGDPGRNQTLGEVGAAIRAVVSPSARAAETPGPAWVDSRGGR